MIEIILLTKDDCRLCDQAKAMLERLAGDYAFNIREVELESEQGRALALGAGAPFPPVLFLNGTPFSYGRPSERKLRKALGGNTIQTRSASGAT